MQLVVVSGLSGSGKSTALHVLEDVGFNCIDNLPLGLLPALVREIEAHGSAYQSVAIGVDARNTWQDLNRFPDLISEIQEMSHSVTVLFLESQIPVLIKRFSETRRKHPLSDEWTSLSEAINKESNLLHPVRDQADQIIDTSNLTLHELRDLVKNRIVGRDDASMAILFESFGFKHGVPVNADLVFDARCLPNPHWKPNLRPQTGKDQDVIDFLESEECVQQMFSDIQSFVGRWLPAYLANNRSYMTIAIGCTGGQHRSVYLAERLQAHFASQYPDCQVRHRDINKHKTSTNA